MPPKPLTMNHRAALAIIHRYAMNICIGKIILKYTPKRSKIHLFFNFFR